jgi:hypothetical protein
MVSSGPSGYVIGRCGVRNDLEGLQPLLQVSEIQNDARSKARLIGRLSKDRQI